MTARYDWTINQGETSTLVFDRSRDGGSDGDAAFPTGSTFRMKAKDKYGGKEIISLVNASFTFSDSGSAAARETFTINISAAETALMAAPGKYVYDVENVTSNGLIVERVLEGTLIVTPEVT
jgi:hypothetical protein